MALRNSIAFTVKLPKDELIKTPNPALLMASVYPFIC